MPGKYSHSVVLADYSSRGIINLPNDQHVAYLRSSPYPAQQHSRSSSRQWLDGPLTSQPRSQSALAYTSRNPAGIGRISSPTRHIIIDTSTEPVRNRTAASPIQRPSTSDRVRMPASRTNQPAPPNQSQHPINGRAAPQLTQKSSRSDLSKKSSTPALTQSPHGAIHVSGGNSQKIRADHFLRETSGPPSQRQATAPGEVKPVTAQPAPGRVSSPLEPAAEIQSKAIAGAFQNDNMVTTHSKGSNASHPAKTIHRPASRETQIYAPQSVAVEPDFDGFSDAEEIHKSYFETTTVSKPTAPPKPEPQRVQRSNKLETPSPTGPSARVVESRTRTLQSVSAERPDSEILTELGTSPLYSYGKLDSLTSLSTLSSRDDTPGNQVEKHGAVKKVVIQVPSQDWRLPEIREDTIFDPDFFTQGLEDPRDVKSQKSDNESVDSFLNRPLGTVSAGRDIDFTKDDADDADSEPDAACPPDVRRYRDEDNVGPPPVLRAMKSEATLGKGAGSPGQTPKTGKIGLFARFRSKNRQRS